jgi:hypothetical protein
MFKIGRFNVAGLVALGVVLGILGWTSAVKIAGWGNAPTKEASATPRPYSDVERSGRVYPNFK